MQKVKIVFLVIPQVHLMDLAGPNQVFMEAIGYDAPFEIEYCSFENLITTSALLPLGKLPDFKKVKIKAGDFLFIPGASIDYIHSATFKSNTRLFNWLKACNDAGVVMCSICTGAFVLAESGILNGRNCTTHWKCTKELQERYPRLNVVENVLFTHEGSIYTSAGIASGMDLALHIVEQFQGPLFANKVAREMVMYNRRSGHHKQKSELLDFRNHIHSGIHKVQDWLQENLHQKHVLPDLAAIANMSDRNFTRIFKKETSLTVNAYITLLRKEKINQLISNPELSRSEIASHCGLKSERQLSRIIHSR
ncbi:MAG: DJ-1/PfpI family protein [Rhizobacter sp.]|nr:DJ-1/PfpI family protein [Ferruginibacter sp.]